MKSILALVVLNFIFSFNVYSNSGPKVVKIQIIGLNESTYLTYQNRETIEAHYKNLTNDFELFYYDCQLNTLGGSGESQNIVYYACSGRNGKTLTLGFEINSQLPFQFRDSYNEIKLKIYKDGSNIGDKLHFSSIKSIYNEWNFQFTVPSERLLVN